MSGTQDSARGAVSAQAALAVLQQARACQVFGGLLANRRRQAIRELLEDFLEVAAQGKGYRASITDDLQHHSDGRAGVQRSQYHSFTGVPDQPLPALLRDAWGNQGWGGVGWSASSLPPGSPSSICPTQALWKGPAVSARVGTGPCMDDRGCPVGRRQGLTDTDFTPAPSGIQQRSLLGEENPRVPLFPAAAHSHPREPSPRG